MTTSLYFCNTLYHNLQLLWNSHFYAKIFKKITGRINKFNHASDLIRVPFFMFVVQNPKNEREKAMFIIIRDTLSIIKYVKSASMQLIALL